MTIAISIGQKTTGKYPWEEPAWIDAAAQNLGSIRNTFSSLGKPEVPDDLFQEIGEFGRRFPEDFAPFPDHHGPPSQGSLGAEECNSLFPAFGRQSGDVQKYSKKYEWKGISEATLGVKAFDTEMSISAKCAAGHPVEASFELPAGRSYALHAPSALAGFFF